MITFSPSYLRQIEIHGGEGEGLAMNYPPRSKYIFYNTKTCCLTKSVKEYMQPQKIFFQTRIIKNTCNCIFFLILMTQKLVLSHLITVYKEMLFSLPRKKKKRRT
ncbi:hypothetical protein DM860_008234 [Cuscuta australis]|uniref:Uncharacterized protein n=1 Tax=Cuscuta australis TaxID=267555 RepID=A0A328D3W7_9ASTE|nr:hypothetical protein DM860_008234 [Cuscuta australis]